MWIRRGSPQLFWASLLASVKTGCRLLENVLTNSDADTALRPMSLNWPRNCFDGAKICSDFFTEHRAHDGWYTSPDHAAPPNTNCDLNLTLQCSAALYTPLKPFP